MAGVKGRSGGPRENAGGARPGSGPKKKPPVVVSVDLVESKGGVFDPRPILEKVALGLIEVNAQQYKALTALLPYTHPKFGEGGKKDAKDEAAKKASGGKFGRGAAPMKLVANNK